MNKELEDYIRSDRQWLREQRIAHAKHRFSSAKTDEERTFWTAVLKANEK